MREILSFIRILQIVDLKQTVAAQVIMNKIEITLLYKLRILITIQLNRTYLIL